MVRELHKRFLAVGPCDDCVKGRRPESITLERAVEVLNEHSYDTGGWEVMEHGKFATNVDKTYDEFEAIAIAEKLLRESE